MNKRTSFALLAVLTAVGTLTISSVHAELPPSCIGCPIEDARILANEDLLNSVPVSVWTDKADYSHNEIVTVLGNVANVVPGFQVTVNVVNPLNSIVGIDQVSVEPDGSFEASFNTAGAIWKYDGTYTIRVSYVGAGVSNSAKIDLSGGVAYIPNYETPVQCGENELKASGHCIPYTVTGGTVTGATINADGNSVIIRIDAREDGTLTYTPDESIHNGIFTVLVDGEEWDDVVIDQNMVTVMFPAGIEEIEIIGTFVIPEFGTIAAMILAVAIISIIAISARSRLSIVPRY